MKKALRRMAVLFAPLFLTSCEVEVHWFERSMYVPWYYVWIPLILCIVIAVTVVHICIVKSEFVCPKCGEVFHPKKFEFSAWLHVNSDRLMRCPKCGYKGFCKHKRG